MQVSCCTRRGRRAPWYYPFGSKTVRRAGRIARAQPFAIFHRGFPFRRILSASWEYSRGIRQRGHRSWLTFRKQSPRYRISCHAGRRIYRSFVNWIIVRRKLPGERSLYEPRQNAGRFNASNTRSLIIRDFQAFAGHLQSREISGVMQTRCLTAIDDVRYSDPQFVRGLRHRNSRISTRPAFHRADRRDGKR